MRASELTDYLNSIIDNEISISLMLWGAPGIGKSSIVAQVAGKHSLDLIDLRLSQLAPTDLRGLPVPTEKTVSWLPPNFLPVEGKGILFLDEINMAPPALQGVAQQLILNRRVGDYVVPPNWFIWAAGNRKEDKAAIFDMPTPLANRFIHLFLDVNSDDFHQYAMDNNFEESIIAFLAFRPSLLHKISFNHLAWPSPRSWEMANVLVKAKLDIEPAVGPVASEYYAYVRLIEDIPDLKGIISGKKAPDFPVEPSLSYAVCIGLALRITNEKDAFNAFKWLMSHAAVEWIQLFTIDAFNKLKKVRKFEAFTKLMIQDDQMREFLTRFSKMALN
jgi:hypothetical protein